MVNAEVYNPSTAGYVRVTPAGNDPAVAVQEFAAHQTISNLVVVKLINGALQVKLNAGTATVFLDVSGYYGPTGTSTFTGTTTARALTGAVGTTPVVVPIAGKSGSPVASVGRS